jgi:Flp pilus assembly pilin Flp
MSGDLRRYLKDETGASSVEYGFLAALLALVIIVSLEGLGLALQDSVDDTADKLRGAERCVEVDSNCDKEKN